MSALQVSDGYSDSSQEQGQKKGETSVGPVRHTEFWLRDGSIVLSVQDTLFKVHQTILSNHSDVFADLFSLPQPLNENSGGETKPLEGKDFMDGCNIVHLYDNSDDFVDLLKAIYYPSHFDDLSPNADLDTLLSFIGGILRLSTKYFIRELRKRCIALLTSRFPTTYQEYLTRSLPPPQSYNPSAFASLSISLSTSTPTSPPVPATPFTPSTPLGTLTTTTTPYPVPTTPLPAIPTPTKDRSKHKPSSIMRAMHLAHQTNVPLILPYASYLLARTTPRRLLSHSPTSISWHQKTICLVGREHLRLAEMSLTHSFLLAFQPSPRCLTPVFCGNARGPHTEWHVLEGGGRGPNPLRAYERWERMNVCSECVRDSRRAHERGREEVWERLPEFFELGAWSELRATQER